jgi:hypothetical protein
MSLLHRLSEKLHHKNGKRSSTLPEVDEAPKVTSREVPSGTSNSDSDARNSSSIVKSLDQTQPVKNQLQEQRPQPALQTFDGPADHEGPPATRQTVEQVFEEFAQLIHSSRRPLPSQTGDGTYIEKDEPSGLFADLRNLSLKDIKTVRHIMEDKASGKPQDDRKMHMEEIIQVSTMCSRLTA